MLGKSGTCDGSGHWMPQAVEGDPRQAGPLQDRVERPPYYVRLAQVPAVSVAEDRRLRPAVALGQHPLAVVVQHLEGVPAQVDPPATLFRLGRADRQLAPPAPQRPADVQAAG